MIVEIVHVNKFPSMSIENHSDLNAFRVFLLRQTLNLNNLA